MGEIDIRPAGEADAAAWAAMRRALWPDGAATHDAEIAAALDDDHLERLALLAFAGDEAVGFVEAAIRHDHVNGCEGSPVVFLEGIYVAEAWRRRGVARRLVERVADWGRSAGCREFASDAAIGTPPATPGTGRSPLRRPSASSVSGRC